MSDQKEAAAPGWYPTPDGTRRWWDGNAWGPVEPAATAPAAKPTPRGPEGVVTVPSAPASGPSGLDVAALVLSILLAPVGLVLGIVALAKAGRTGRRSLLGLIATIIGGVGTVAAIAAVVLVFVVAGAMDGEQRRVAFCARAVDLPAVASEWAALQPEVHTLYEVRLTPVDHDPAALQQLSDELAALSSRVGDIAGYEGGSYADAFNAGWAFSEGLDSVVTDIGMDSFMAEGDMFYDLDGSLARFAEAASTTCMAG